MQETKFGSFYVGSILSQIIYGVVVLQTYFYIHKYPRDDFGIKILVLFLWMLGTTRVAFATYTVYYYQVSSFVKPQWRLDGVWSIFASTALNVAMMVAVQCFFVRRICQLSKRPLRWWITGFIMSLVVAQFAFGIQTVVEFFMEKEFSRLHEANAAAIPFRVTNTAANIAISVVLCILMRQHHVSYENTDSVRLDLLLTFIAERFILITVLAVVNTILSTVSPDSFYGAAVEFIFGEVYVNTFLASLNARQSLKGKGVPNFRSSAVSDPNQSRHVSTVLQMDTFTDSSVADIDGRFVLRSSDFLGTAPSS